MKLNQVKNENKSFEKNDKYMYFDRFKCENRKWV